MTTDHSRCTLSARQWERSLLSGYLSNGQRPDKWDSPKAGPSMAGSSYSRFGCLPPPVSVYNAVARRHGGRPSRRVIEAGSTTAEPLPLTAISNPRRR